MMAIQVKDTSVQGLTLLQCGTQSAMQAVL
jgi:hypothetical protein